MAYEKQNAQRDLSALTEKAVRRGKKLEKTHLNIVVQCETVSPTEEFLKLVRLDVKKLKEHAEEFDRTVAPNSKKPGAERKPESERCLQGKMCGHKTAPAARHPSRKPAADAAQPFQPAKASE